MGTEFKMALVAWRHEEKPIKVKFRRHKGHCTCKVKVKAQPVKSVVSNDRVDACRAEKYLKIMWALGSS